jgi:SNF2 family DNA or RNA helicase
LPRFNKQLGVDYHIVRVPMSDVQFKAYETARVEERKLEKKKPKQAMAEDYEDKASTYRIFSRLFCNFIIPDRPIPIRTKKKDEDEEGKEEEEEEESNIVAALKQGKKVEAKQDIQDNREGEIEGDEVLEDLGGTTYMERLQNKMKEMADNSDNFFTPEALQTYSPKFLHVLENIQDTEYQGLHLVYSQFRTAEGIGLFTLVLNKNGFTQFKIKKNTSGLWQIDIPEVDEGKPTYALYTGTETVEEKEIVRKIYNGEWDDIPDSISSVLKTKYRNNNMGEVIKVFMITSSGSEGINLRNTRYVHLMDPYWHPVRSEQVIGRARRICSHKDLPPALQTVEVFVYLMVFTETQLKSDEAIELKRKDLSKALPKTPQTSDQYLFEISSIKANLTDQLTEAIKESSFDCYIYSNGKCVNFGDPTIDKFSYVPDYAEQQNDTTAQANKIAIEWIGKPITIAGVEYVYRKVSDEVINIYDFKSYEAALKDPNVAPVQVGTLEKNEKGQRVFRQLVNR